MTNNSNKDKCKESLENHKTAAWANIEKTKPISNVAQPSISQTNNSKEYADENEK